MENFYRLCNNPENSRPGSPEFHFEAEKFEQITKQDTTGKKRKTMINIVCLCMCWISNMYSLESVLSDISYSRVEDSLDSDRVFEDALDRWEPEGLDTIKRKRASANLNSNEVKKEIEVILNLLFVLKCTLIIKGY